MLIDTDAINPVDGGEGSKIKQLFHPHNTMLGIRYSIVKCTLEAGKSSKQHVLKSSEVYYFLSGTGVMQIDEQRLVVRAAQAVYVPPLCMQQLQNTGTAPLEFLCIVDPAWRQEDETIIK
jgi:mannose-6-phosphate isomerase-like protein (cupin superfamily)